jgi:hypothetical protein
VKLLAESQPFKICERTIRGEGQRDRSDRQQERGKPS